MTKAVPKYSDQTRTTATEAAYLAGGQLLVKRALKAVPHAMDAVDALQVHFADRALTLRASTTRTYKSQIIAALQFLAAKGEISQARAAAGCETVADLLLKCRGRPPARTSAKKNKTPPFEEYRALTKDLCSRNFREMDLPDKVLARMLGVCPYVGIRPVEWLTARLEDRRLILVNAKSTNGRSPGPVRSIDLSEAPLPVIRATEPLIADIKTLSPTRADWQKTLKMLDERLARDCARVGISRWSISIFRQIAQANWKQAGFSKAEIAALAGHISINTSRNYYAGGKHGWIPEFAVARPDPALVVRISLHNHVAIPTNECASSIAQLTPHVDSVEEEKDLTNVEFHPKGP